MGKPRAIAAALLGVAGIVLIVAGAVLIQQGRQDQHRISRELSGRRLRFPADPALLPINLQPYAGQRVRTGPQARAYADLIEFRLRIETGGRSYAQLSQQWIADGRRDARLAELRQAAFAGESLRNALLDRYEAWQVAWLGIAVGGSLVALGGGSAIGAWHLGPKRPRVRAPP